eukprot:2801635-Rhodomonas_salina.1
MVVGLDYGCAVSDFVMMMRSMMLKVLRIRTQLASLIMLAVGIGMLNACKNRVSNACKNMAPNNDSVLTLIRESNVCSAETHPTIKCAMVITQPSLYGSDTHLTIPRRLGKSHDPPDRPFSHN